MELKEKTRKLYGKVKIALQAKKSSLATDDVIHRDEIVVDLSVISRRSSVFTAACNGQISRLRKQQNETNSSTPIDYSKLVTSPDDYVIISGIPGSGKTTLVQTLLFKWATNQLWKEYEFVFVIYLRHLVRFKDHQDGVTAERILSYFYPDYDWTDIRKSGNVLLILEGFDELFGKNKLRSKREDYDNYTQAIFDLFDPKNPSLPFTRLVTSRPGSCPILLETVLNKHHQCKIFFVAGFNEKSILR